MKLGTTESMCTTVTRSLGASHFFSMFPLWIGECMGGIFQPYLEEFSVMVPISKSAKLL